MQGASYADGSSQAGGSGLATPLGHIDGKRDEMASMASVVSVRLTACERVYTPLGGLNERDVHTLHVDHESETHNGTHNPEH